jgi:TIR domain
VSTPIRVFFSYAHKDEALRDQLAAHLSVLARAHLIDSWHDRKISAGAERAEQIDKKLEEADVILLLISADFMASDYCFEKEMMRALQRHKAKEARVVPIILRPTDWTSAPFAGLQALPKHGRPVTSWPNQDEAWTDVAKGIRNVIHEVRSKRGEAPW